MPKASGKRTTGIKSLENSVFKTVDEYHAFAMKHNVFGGDASKLKKKMDKLYVIPEPKVKKQ